MRGSGGGVTLFARLTANGGQPVPGEPVSFATGVVQWCTSVVTNSSGVASCSLSRYETALLREQFGVFSAYFGGDTPAGLPAGQRDRRGADRRILLIHRMRAAGFRTGTCRPLRCPPPESLPVLCSSRIQF